MKFVGFQFENSQGNVTESHREISYQLFQELSQLQEISSKALLHIA